MKKTILLLLLLTTLLVSLTPTPAINVQSVRTRADIILKDGHTVVQRTVAYRSDGIAAYGYVAGSALRVAFVKDASVGYFDLPAGSAGYFGGGCEMAFTGNKLFIAGSMQGPCAVFEVNAPGWPVRASLVRREDIPNPGDLNRDPTVTAAPNGGVVVAWYNQGAGEYATVAYRNPAGTWTSSRLGVGAYYWGATQSAGNCQIVTHPNGQVWLLTIKDGGGTLTVAQFIAGETLTHLGNALITHPWPHNGIVANRECVFDTELPLNFRAWAVGDKVRIMGNQFDFVWRLDPWFAKISRLTVFDVDSNLGVHFVGLTEEWTERVIPDYGSADGRYFMVRVGLADINDLSPYNRQLRDGFTGEVETVMDYWTPLGFGRHATVFPRSGGLIFRSYYNRNEPRDRTNTNQE